MHQTNVKNDEKPDTVNVFVYYCLAAQKASEVASSATISNKAGTGFLAVGSLVEANFIE